MCEVESSVVTGDDMTSPVGLLNESSSEGITEVAREEEVLLAKSSEVAEEEIPQEVDPPPEGTPPEEAVELRRGSVGDAEPSEVKPPISQIIEVTEPEGVDPFKPVEKVEVANSDPLKEVDQDDTNFLRELSLKDGRRDSKTVSFREPEKDETSGESDAEVKEILVLNSTSSNGSQEGDGAVEKRKSSSNKQQRSLGENNPVYRLSMKLSPNLFNIQEIPGANQHREAEKAGYLTKLSGRSFPYIAQWKRRYCVLSKGRLYYYEREDSKSGEKSNGVINLEYFDQVSEAGPKDCKKATNVFVITSQDRSFFDPGRHLFSADTLPDMKDWVRKLQSALEQTRNNNRPTTATSASPSIKKDGGKKPKEQTTTLETNSQNNTKERTKKKKESHRPRKSSKVGDVPDGFQQSPESAAPSEPPMMTSPVGIQLPGMTSAPRGGVALPGMSPIRKDPPPPEDTKETTTSDSNQQTEEGLPVAGPTLSCVTKQRNKGPQGRRAPQRRSNAASSLKKRASSLSALEHQDLSDNRSESSQGTRDSDRLSKTTENDLEAVEEEEDDPSKHESFEDIDKDLFFKKEITQIAQSENENTGTVKAAALGVDSRKADGEGTKETKSSSLAKDTSGNKENHVSRSRSRNSSLFGNRLSRFRETMMTIKRNRFRSKDQLTASHPDEEVERSGWSCSIL